MVMLLDSMVSTVSVHTVMSFVTSCRRGICGQARRAGEDENAHEGARNDGLHRVDRAQPVLAST
jgi:hypothetical protein